MPGPRPSRASERVLRSGSLGSRPATATAAGSGSTAAPLRLEADRRHLTLPVIGKLRSKENTRRLVRLLTKGRARVLSMTLSEQSGRLFVSVATIVAQTPGTQRAAWPLRDRPRHRRRVGGDRPCRRFHRRITHPAPWLIAQRQRRRLARKHRAASSDPEATVRRKPSWRPWTGKRPTCAPAIHILTTALPAATALSSSKISTLPRWPVAWAGARSAARYIRQASAGSARSWPTNPAGRAGSLGGGPLVRVLKDPSRLRWLSGRPHLGQRVWGCPPWGQQVDRNAYAAWNLRDCTGPVIDRDVQRGGVAAPVPFVGDHGGQAHAAGVGVRGPGRRSRSVRTRPELILRKPRGLEPRRGVPVGECS